jgi:hypothetical protein
MDATLILAAVSLTVEYRRFQNEHIRWLFIMECAIEIFVGSVMLVHLKTGDNASGGMLLTVSVDAALLAALSSVLYVIILIL